MSRTGSEDWPLSGAAPSALVLIWRSARLCPAQDLSGLGRAFSFRTDKGGAAIVTPVFPEACARGRAPRNAVATNEADRRLRTAVPVRRA
jgi:hypothetical protein